MKLLDFSYLQTKVKVRTKFDAFLEIAGSGNDFFWGGGYFYFKPHCKPLPFSIKEVERYRTDLEKTIESNKQRKVDPVLRAALTLKGSQFNFSKFSFLFHLKNHHSKRCQFQSSVETVKPFGRMKQIYCSCLYLTV